MGLVEWAGSIYTSEMTEWTTYIIDHYTKAWFQNWLFVYCGICGINMVLCFAVAIASWLFYRRLLEFHRVRAQFGEMCIEVVTNNALYSKAKEEKGRVELYRRPSHSIDPPTPETKKRIKKERRNKRDGKSEHKRFGLNWNQLVPDEDIEAKHSAVSELGPSQNPPFSRLWLTLKPEKDEESLRSDLDLKSEGTAKEPPTFVSDVNCEGAVSTTTLVDDGSSKATPNLSTAVGKRAPSEAMKMSTSSGSGNGVASNTPQPMPISRNDNRATIGIPKVANGKGAPSAATKMSAGSGSGNEVASNVPQLTPTSGTGNRATIGTPSLAKGQGAPSAATKMNTCSRNVAPNVAKSNTATNIVPGAARIAPGNGAARVVPRSSGNEASSSAPPSEYIAK